MSIEQAAATIRQAQAFLFTAGAGMGVDSGLPDFRGDEGFWRAYPALRGHSFVDMANPRWFEQDPSRAWGFYGHRLNLYRAVEPHAGFQTLLQWAASTPHFVFTSNVDGQFQKAGFAPERVVECHGSIHHLQCLQPGERDTIWSAAGVEVIVDAEEVRALEPLPRDPRGNIARPNILMFGDWSWDETRSAAQSQRLDSFLAQHPLSGLVVIEIGAGTAIPSVRSLGERLMQHGAKLVRINPRESHGPAGCISVPKGGLEGLTEIARLLP